MSEPMTEARARELLGDCIKPDGSLDSLGHYMAYSPGDEAITLDDVFGIDELEAMVWWMRKINAEKSGDPETAAK